MWANCLNQRLERVMGIEPTSSAWKAEVLPLNYTRATILGAALPGACAVAARYPRPISAATRRLLEPSFGSHPPREDKSGTADKIPSLRTTQLWWRGEDSNLRRLSRQIYSLIPLTAREPLRENASRVFCWRNKDVSTAIPAQVYCPPLAPGGQRSTSPPPPQRGNLFIHLWICNGLPRLEKLIETFNITNKSTFR